MSSGGLVYPVDDFVTAATNSLEPIRLYAVKHHGETFYSFPLYSLQHIIQWYPSIAARIYYSDTLLPLSAHAQLQRGSYSTHLKAMTKEDADSIVWTSLPLEEIQAIIMEESLAKCPP